MLPGKIINVGGICNNTITISSLEDADRFVHDRIGSNGMFDCYLGEEVLINDGEYNAVWQVVGVDTELDKGDIALTQHHISLVPKTVIDTSEIHSNNHRFNGYINSNTMYPVTMRHIEFLLEGVLGNHLLERRVKLTDEVGGLDNKSSSNEYYSVRANLMCQQQVFGTVDSDYGNEYDTGDDTEQLPGFKTGKVKKDVGTWWWLRDICGYSDGRFFSSVNTDGSLGYASVTDSDCGVRPLITIG